LFLLYKFLGGQQNLGCEKEIWGHCPGKPFHAYRSVFTEPWCERSAESKNQCGTLVDRKGRSRTHTMLKLMYKVHHWLLRH